MLRLLFSLCVPARTFRLTRIVCLCVPGFCYNLFSELHCWADGDKTKQKKKECASGEEQTLQDSTETTSLMSYLPQC